MTDDTNAIQAAINGNSRIVYFPNGTYLVSDTLIWKNTAGNFGAFITLQGEQQCGVVIQLKGSLAAFSDPSAPKPAIHTASQNPAWDVTQGGGNQAFCNSIYDLTVDVGQGNSGAIGILYLTNNKGTLTDVTIRSQSTGHSGLALTLQNPGPCLVKNLQVIGFDYGINL